MIGPPTLRHRSTCTTHSLFLCVLLLACTLVKVQASNAGSNERDFGTSISVSSDLVVLPVRVTDSDGNFVSGLTKDNFMIYEERERQIVTVFQQEDTPVSLGLIVDHSASMKSKLPSVSAAVKAFAGSGNPHDEAFVIDFNDRLSFEPLGTRMTQVSDGVAEAIGSLSATGRTALYDAVIEGIDHVKSGHWERKALIIISDGGDNASSSKQSDVVKLARQSDVVLYAVILTDRKSKDENPKALIRLCHETGGTALVAQQHQAMTELSLEIARDLRQQYTLGFVPDRRSTSPSFRKLEVQVLAPQLGKLNVRTRRGYFAQKKDILPLPHATVNDKRSE